MFIDLEEGPWVWFRRSLDLLLSCFYLLVFQGAGFLCLKLPVLLDYCVKANKQAAPHRGKTSAFEVHGSCPSFPGSAPCFPLLRCLPDARGACTELFKHKRAGDMRRKARRIAQRKQPTLNRLSSGKLQKLDKRFSHSAFSHNNVCDPAPLLFLQSLHY